MILSIGTDVVSVARIRRLMLHPRFLSRVLSERERTGLDPTAQRVAGRWAAKEAAAKCLLPLGLHPGWHDVEVLNRADGSPYLVFAPSLDLDERWRFHLSISHERETAVAFCVAEAP
ncbi:MAG: holo-ACP synthase [Fimbriimonadaceae bacterium]|nr:holo-ACP synthase [Fimbriimonadaceae bacterium]